MNLAIEKIILIIIMVIVLLVIVIFLLIPNSLTGQLSTQDKLRQCCQKYIARGCPDDINIVPQIECPCKVVFNPGTMSFQTECDGVMADYASELGLYDINKLKLFCNCIG